MDARPFRGVMFRGCVASLALALVTVAACDGAESYVYTARRYDPAASCLEPYAPVEVVEGPGAAPTCPETCLTVGTEVYVTTLCPPLPAIASELAPDDEACLAARAASATTCGEELDPDASSEPDAAPASDGGTDGSAQEPDLDASGPDATDGA